nr:hypothetical protein HmN_000244400 [Hymenolepis microstoma]
MDLEIASQELVCGAHESHSWVYQPGDIAEKDAQIKDLSERLAAHEMTKDQALEKALRDVETKETLG